MVGEEECASATGELGLIYLSLVPTVPSVHKVNSLDYSFTFHTPQSYPSTRLSFCEFFFLFKFTRDIQV